jgi:integrase
VRLSQALATVFGRRGWSIATARKYATMLKRILALLDLPEGFVDSLRLVQIKKAAPVNKALGKHGSLPLDHPVRSRLDAWVECLRNGTRNRSELSLRNVMSFYCNVCLPVLGLDLEHWPEDVKAQVASYLDDHPNALRQIIGNDEESSVRAGRLRFLLQHILHIEGVEVPKPMKRPLQADDGVDDDGRDVHRISAEHLELLHQEATKEPLDELLFMLMLTTGLRVGGVSKILTCHVAEVKSGKYVVKKEGKTKEKGNKFARFLLCPEVQEQLHAWLSKFRPADSGPFLFPGAVPGGRISTDCIRSRFQRLCKKCGLEGREFHPHALRHSHAHILLECGNTVESVSKCLNHSSTAVTEKFYLKESAAEVQGRCNIPWFRKETEGEKQQRALDALPNFLKSGGEAVA